MEFDVNRIYTQSIKCASYVQYITGYKPEVEIGDKGNTFTFERNKATEDALHKYKRSWSDDTELMVNLNKFDEVVKQLKRQCAELKA